MIKIKSIVHRRVLKIAVLAYLGAISIFINRRNKLSFKFSNAFLVILFSIFMGIACGSASAGQTVSLAWDPNSETNLAGYVIYYGTASGQYSNSNNVGNTTNATISGLQEGGNYYFVVTAYDASGLESDPSNEVNYQVPGWILGVCIPHYDNNTRVATIEWPNNGWWDIWVVSGPTANGPWTPDTDFALVGYSTDLATGRVKWLFEHPPVDLSVPMRVFRIASSDPSLVNLPPAGALPQ